MTKKLFWTALAVVIILAGGIAVKFGYLELPRPETSALISGKSPAGDAHPGEIVFDDKVAGSGWTEKANEVPTSIAWVEVSGKWVPVVRIEITGTSKLLEFTKFGPDGQWLESSVQERIID